MRGTNDVNIDLAYYRDIKSWKPKIGDFIIWHGWFTHWFGVTSVVSPDSIKVCRAGIPKLLFSMNESEMLKNTIEIKLREINKSFSGTFAIMQMQKAPVWYI